MGGDSLMLDILHPKGIHQCCLSTAQGSATCRTQTKHGTGIAKRRRKEQEEMQSRHGKKRNDALSVNYLARHGQVLYPRTGANRASHRRPS